MEQRANCSKLAVSEILRFFLEAPTLTIPWLLNAIFKQLEITRYSVADLCKTNIGTHPCGFLTLSPMQQKTPAHGLGPTPIPTCGLKGVTEEEFFAGDRPHGSVLQRGEDKKFLPEGGFCRRNYDSINEHSRMYSQRLNLSNSKAYTRTFSLK